MEKFLDADFKVKAIRYAMTLLGNNPGALVRLSKEMKAVERSAWEKA